VLHVSVDRKSAYIEKSAHFVKRLTGLIEVPAASVQNYRRDMIRPPHSVVLKGLRDAPGDFEPLWRTKAP